MNKLAFAFDNRKKFLVDILAQETNSDCETVARCLPEIIAASSIVFRSRKVSPAPLPMIQNTDGSETVLL
jgi:hypothetical protein